MFNGMKNTCIDFKISRSKVKLSFTIGLLKLGQRSTWPFMLNNLPQATGRVKYQLKDQTNGKINITSSLHNEIYSKCLDQKTTDGTQKLVIHKVERVKHYYIKKYFPEEGEKLHR